jgi:phosphatidylserine/phosphatidylglycerophosphate/cardiolipin synthase-like enzyme
LKLLVQPDDGIEPLMRAIDGAKKCIEIAIFRFDRKEIERALAGAVSRGVPVTALIAHTNRAGEGALRQLETRLLAAGVTVARTADDLVRYHGKWMIVDGKLYLMGFNLTRNDMEHSRSFAVVTSARDVVHEASTLFAADCKRQPYKPGHARFAVSPLNSRKVLGDFIRGAGKELLIYDPKISDREMIRLLAERAKAGVSIRVLGRLMGKAQGTEVRRLAGRLHTRTIVRDGSEAFIGSQSLRKLELDERREVGLIFRDSEAVRRIAEVFEKDWKAAAKQAQPAETEPAVVPPEKIAKIVAKKVTKELPPVTPLVSSVVEEAVGEGAPEAIPPHVEEIVKEAVRDAVREAVKGVVAEVVEKTAGAAK